MTDYLVQIILVLLGAILELFALLLKERGQKILLGVLGVICICAAGVLIVSEFTSQADSSESISNLTKPSAVIPSNDNRTNVSFLDVPANVEAGVTWNVPATGMFSFGIESGAYNGWGTDDQCAYDVPERPGCWRTRVHAYLGCEIIWNRPAHSPEMSEPMSPSFAVGDATFLESMEAAEAFAVTLAPQTVNLNKDDCVRFVVIDGYSPETGFSAYTDNRGDPDRNNSIQIRIVGP